MKKITRQAAIAAGKKQYYTGKPCLRGHLAPRWCLNGRCRQCSREDEKARYKRISAELKGASKND